jgi:hydrogenase nickel incorporation protein HypA/HybF
MNIVLKNLFKHNSYHFGSIIICMHELAITESILDIAQRHARQADAKRVTDINIMLGQLSSIVDDSVQFYWDIISQSTICEKAQLHFQRIPAEFQCLDCQTIYQISKELSPCPNCQSTRVNLKSGQEFWVDSIEIEK